MYLSKNSYAREQHAGPGMEFARAYYFDHCTQDEQDQIDSLILTMVENVHKKSTAPFSPANALEVIGSLLLFFEKARMHGWHPAILTEDVTDKGGQACIH
jgi:hypothetical protein